MGRSRVLAIIFILLIVSTTSNAKLFNSRKLVDLAPIQSTNSSSEQISVSNTPVEGEKEVNGSTVNDNKSVIAKEKPGNPKGNNDPPKTRPEELNSTIVNDGRSQTEKQKPKDPQVINEAPKDLKDQNSTVVNDGSSKAESEQPKDPQGRNGPTNIDSKEPNTTVVNGGSSKADKEKPKDPQPQGGNHLPKLDPDGSKNDKNVTVETPPPVEKKENEEKKKIDETIISEVNTNESCQKATKMCRIGQTLLACIQTPQNVGKHLKLAPNIILWSLAALAVVYSQKKDPAPTSQLITSKKHGSTELLLVVQNEGEKGVKVNINIQPPLDGSPQPPIEIPKHQVEKIDISSILGKGAEIVLNTGDASCRLQLDRHVSVENILQQVSLYSKRMTPIYGAYFLFLVALLFGGTWACCKLRKKRHQDGVAYQELEMGMPESASAANVVAADGWDQDWDDDWDEENAVKSPGGHTYGNISANGLTSRSSKKDGWENDWDDS
ncbi:hypothetical protein H5410_045733 [Solanum commersonii]|uniref:DUF7356 domain-containing protein n=1 Tax=Solanum commersonii TaxID=4109 RepID=A0A9J5XAD4_SOLCO|nr:hypothetical protein H5410_045733 [Solanum commersonii]